MSLSVENEPDKCQIVRDHAEQQSYLPQLTRSRLLSASEELELAIKVQRGDKQARDRLVESNMRLVINVARSYSSSLIPFEDLVQEGAIGLMTAADRFDPAKGFRFSTYATHWIRQSISRAIEYKSKSIRLPAHVSETLRNIERARVIWIRENGDDPTTEQLAEFLNVPVRKISTLLHAWQEPVSLDTLVGEDDATTLAALLNDDNAVDPQQKVLSTERRDVLSSLLATLTPREQEIMRRRLGYDDESATMLNDIGAAMRIPRERVRQIELQALRKLKFAAKRLGLVGYLCA